MDKHTFSYEHNGSEVTWDIRDIWRATKSLPAVSIQVKDLKKQYDKVAKDYEEDDYERIKEADLTYPIIISKPVGDSKQLIVDGHHRIGKCLEEKIPSIKAKYIKKMPRPLYCKGEPFTIPGLEFDWYDPRTK